MYNLVPAYITTVTLRFKLEVVIIVHVISYPSKKTYRILSRITKNLIRTSFCNILCVCVNCNMLAHARETMITFLSQSRSEMFTSLVAA